MRVGIIGCGVAMPHHILGIQGVKDAHLVALCDLDRATLKKAADGLNVRNTFTDFSEMIKQQRPDVVHILTPPKSHAHIAIEAMNNGCHVLLEKPMAMSVKESDDIIAAEKKNNVKLCLMHNHMFDPPILKARRLLEQGILGDLLNLECSFFIDKEKMIEEQNNLPGHWVHKLPLGIFGEHATPHLLYLVASFLHNIRDVRVIKRYCSQSENIESIKGMSVLLGAERSSGLLVMLDNMEYPQFFLRIYGTKAALHINMFNLTLTVEKYRNLPKVMATMLQAVQQNFQGILTTGCNVVKIMAGRLKRRPGHRLLIKQFYESIRQDTPPPATGEQGREVVRILEMIHSELKNRQ